MSKKRKSPKRAKRKKLRRMAKKKSAAKPKPRKNAHYRKDGQLPRASKAAPAPQPRRGRPATMYSILHPGVELQAEPDFRDAPEGWTRADARNLAAKAGLKLTEDHWEVIRVLQGCYKDEVSPRLRLLHDALEARFAQ